MDPMITVETPAGKLTAEVCGDPNHPGIMICLRGQQIAVFDYDTLRGIRGRVRMDAIPSLFLQGDRILQLLAVN